MKSALIVESSLELQERIKNLTEDSGYEVRVVNSIAEAKTLLTVGNFDLIISETILPDGQLSELSNFPDTHIIFIAANESARYAEATLKMNKACFVIKPFSDLTLGAAIKRIQLQSQKQAFATVFGKHKNPIHIPIDEIEFIKSEGNYSSVITSNNVKHAVKKSAKQLVSDVDGSNFIQIERSTFVNKSKLVRISLSDNKVFTKNHELCVSRSFKKNLYRFHHLDK